MVFWNFINKTIAKWIYGKLYYKEHNSYLSTSLLMQKDNPGQKNCFVITILSKLLNYFSPLENRF